MVSKRLKVPPVGKEPALPVSETGLSFFLSQCALLVRTQWGPKDDYKVTAGDQKAWGSPPPPIADS